MIVVFMLSKPNKFKKFKIPRIRYKKKKKKGLFVSLSQWPNWQFPQSVIRLYNVWILTLFTSYLSEFLHQNHLSSWPNTSVTLCPNHKIGMCTLLFCATLSISFPLMLGFWTSNHFTFGTWQTSQSWPVATLSELSRHFFPSLFVWFILWETKPLLMYYFIFHFNPKIESLSYPGP